MISIHAPREGSDLRLLNSLGGKIGFQSTLPARGATGFNSLLAFLSKFQSTLPARGATRKLEAIDKTIDVFQSTLPARGATGVFDMIQAAGKFQSTLPARGATSTRPIQPRPMQFQSTLPARGATYGANQAGANALFQSTLPARGATIGYFRRDFSRCISIHAPREGSDMQPSDPRKIYRYFNPRSPRGERPRQSFGFRFFSQFQSTLPARGATWNLPAWCASMDDFNPRSPRGERLGNAIHANRCIQFQSTLPARGATSVRCPLSQYSLNFNPRSPRGERLPYTMKLELPNLISIHAPREGSDKKAAPKNTSTNNFNPRSPRGERLSFPYGDVGLFRISIHAPREGSDRRLYHDFYGLQISIHAPREGSDQIRMYLSPTSSNFNPRSPRGERPYGTGNPGWVKLFQSTLPARGATRSCSGNIYRRLISIHAPREGSDSLFPESSDGIINFNPRSPRGERRRGKAWLRRF